MLVELRCGCIELHLTQPNPEGAPVVLCYTLERCDQDYTEPTPLIGREVTGPKDGNQTVSKHLSVEAAGKLMGQLAQLVQDGHSGREAYSALRRLGVAR